MWATTKPDERAKAGNEQAHPLPEVCSGWPPIAKTKRRNMAGRFRPRHDDRSTLPHLCGGHAKIADRATLPRSLGKQCRATGRRKPGEPCGRLYGSSRSASSATARRKSSLPIWKGRGKEHGRKVGATVMPANQLQSAAQKALPQMPYSLARKGLPLRVIPGKADTQ